LCFLVSSHLLLLKKLLNFFSKVEIGFPSRKPPLSNLNEMELLQNNNK
jgi:hypothetical protein